MNDLVTPLAAWCALLIEVMGIGIITAIAIYGLFRAAIRLYKQNDQSDIFRELRQRLGGGILLGLEFLIAADIIHTVAVKASFQSVGVLALIVGIRTFLSFTLQVELTGRWPWQDTR